jgi:outer membrane protein
MRRICCCYALFILLIFPGCVLAMETDEQSVRSLIILGLQENLGLKIEKTDVARSEEAIIVEEAQFDALFFAKAQAEKTRTPYESTLSNISESKSEQYTGQIGISRRLKSGLISSLALDSFWQSDNDTSDNLDPRYRTALTFSLTQPLLRDFGQDTNTTDLRIARNNLSQSALKQRLQAQLLALQIELLSCQLAGESKIVELQEEAVSLAKDLYSANQRRFDTGVIPVSEVQQAETELASRELSLSEADQARELNLSELNRQLNHSLPLDFPVSELYPFDAVLSLAELPSEQQLFDLARKKNLTLRLASIDIDTTAIEQTFYRNQLKPQLDLNIQAGINGLSGKPRTSSVNSSYEGNWTDSFPSTIAADGYEWGIGIEFSLPLGNRAAKAKLNQAKLQHKQTMYQQRDLEAELRLSLQQQIINLRKAFEQVKIAERFVGLAKISLQQEERRLKEGLSDTFRIINFQVNMINAKIGRINAMVQYFNSVAQMNFTRGIILEQHDINLTQVAEENSLETL